jgi:hypothetical protein
MPVAGVRQVWQDDVTVIEIKNNPLPEDLLC